MAQESRNRESDGTGYKAPESHRLCANNCGFFGSPATLDLCSKCYRDHRLKEEHASSAKAAVEKSLKAAAAPVTNQASVIFSAVQCSVSDPLKHASSSSSILPAGESPAPQPPHRCWSCRKRVGLTGFRCRCGRTFCSLHRYPEEHKCEYDYKTHGKDLIRKDNPVVKAEKLEKI